MAAGECNTAVGAAIGTAGTTDTRMMRMRIINMNIADEE